MEVNKHLSDFEELKPIVVEISKVRKLSKQNIKVCKGSEDILDVFEGFGGI